MASGTLYTYSGSFRANKILIAAAYSGSNVSVPDFEYGKTNASPEFLKKFPLGKVPAFESNGVFLNESDAIAQYVSNDSLLGGNNAASRAAVREYISFTESEIIPSACTWVFPTLGFTQENKQETEKAMDHLKSCLAKLNDDLLTKTYLVGERITLADITLTTALVMLYVQVFDENFRASFGNVNRWFLTCINQPNFKKVLGDIKLCEQMAVFDKKRFQELQKKGDTKPKKQDKKQEKPKQEQAPEAPKPAKVDLFADVPKSDFNLGDWKEKYGKGAVDESQKWFADNFDTNAYSMWFGVHKYPEDNDNENKALTYIEGVKNRIEGLRKHVHAMFLINRINNNFVITCVVISKGTTLVFDRNEDWQTDSIHFNWKRMEGKELTNDYLNKYFYLAQNIDGIESDNHMAFI